MYAMKHSQLEISVTLRIHTSFMQNFLQSPRINNIGWGPTTLELQNMDLIYESYHHQQQRYYTK